mgnify:CR=1 FL=1
MQDRVKTSFIPKQSLSVERRASAGKNSIGVINVAASVILIAALVGAAGVFLFEQFTIQSIAQKRESLDRARAAFEPATIKELSRLNTRLTAGSTLLSTHPAPSRLFSEIEDITLSSVRFRDFSFSETAPGRITVSMNGEARSFNALALQSDAFGASDFFTEPIFDNLNLNEAGNVVFSFTGVVSGNTLRYQPRGSEPASTDTGAAPSESSPNNEVTP